MDRRAEVVIYLGLAAVLGAIIGLNTLPDPIQLGIVAAGIIAAVIWRSQVLHESAWSGVDVAGGAVLALTYLPIAALVGHWPFT